MKRTAQMPEQMKVMTSRQGSAEKATKALARARPSAFLGSLGPRNATEKGGSSCPSWPARVNKQRTFQDHVTIAKPHDPSRQPRELSSKQTGLKGLKSSCSVFRFPPSGRSKISETTSERAVFRQIYTWRATGMSEPSPAAWLQLPKTGKDDVNHCSPICLRSQSIPGDFASKAPMTPPKTLANWLHIHETEQDRIK